MTFVLRPIAWLLLLLPSTAPAQDDGTTAETAGHVLDSVMRRYESYGFSGTVLVAKDGAVVLSRGYGLADRTRGIRNSSSTRFEIASLTKTFTAAAILRLEAEGRLGTEDLLSKHLGPFPPGKAAATIHHLATHTAGLVQEGADLGRPGSRQDFVESVKRTSRESPPGERYRYTNAGYSMLAALIETVSGESYESYVRRNLFTRAGITQAGFRGDFTAHDSLLAKGYLGTPVTAQESLEVAYSWGTRGAGGIIASVPEVYQWVLSLQDTLVLTESSRAKMFHPWPEEGYGWHVETDQRGIPVFHKGGGMLQYASQILIYPSARVIIVWASNNLQQRWRRTVNRALTAVALGEPIALPPVRTSASQPQLAKFASNCVTADGRTVVLRVGNGFLFTESDSAKLPSHLPFFPTGSGNFAGFDPATGAVTTLRCGSR